MYKINNIVWKSSISKFVKKLILQVIALEVSNFYVQPLMVLPIYYFCSIFVPNKIICARRSHPEPSTYLLYYYIVYYTYYNQEYTLYWKYALYINKR